MCGTKPRLPYCRSSQIAAKMMKTYDEDHMSGMDKVNNLVQMHELWLL